MATHYQNYGRKYYQKNKSRCIERNKILQDKYKKQWTDYKASLSCSTCGMSHPAVIDFHHIKKEDPEKQHVNNLIKNRRYAAAYKEIREKCVVLCANCHRIHHYNEEQMKKGAEAPFPTDSVKNQAAPGEP
jgi:acetylornithine/succinyldiaminopimelate/putrescine aminotransferase